MDAVQQRLEGAPEALRLRRQTLEHVFGTLEVWMGSSRFLTGTLPRVSTGMGWQVLASDPKRAIRTLATPLRPAQRQRGPPGPVGPPLHQLSAHRDTAGASAFREWPPLRDDPRPAHGPPR